MSGAAESAKENAAFSLFRIAESYFLVCSEIEGTVEPEGSGYPAGIAFPAVQTIPGKRREEKDKKDRRNAGIIPTA